MDHLKLIIKINFLLDNKRGWEQGVKTNDWVEIIGVGDHVGKGIRLRVRVFIVK